MIHKDEKPKYHSWLEWKEEGRRAYEAGDYEAALEAYRTALRPEFECPSVGEDQAVLWSNVVACRLHTIANSPDAKATARQAVEEAKRCVAAHPQWSKGHVRLASAYIALGGHSNAACNALQTALRLDPRNSVARQMLIQELKQRDHGAAATTSGAENSHAPYTRSASAPPQHEGVDDTTRDPPQNPRYVPPGRSQSFPTRSTTSSSSTSTSQSTAPANGPVTTWNEWLLTQWHRLSHFYQHGLSADFKNLLRIVGVVLVLYVLAGGWYGLQSHSRNRDAHNNSSEFGASTRGNYGAGNAYDRFYQQRRGGSANNGGSYQGSYHRRDTSYDDFVYDTNTYSRRSGGFWSSSFSMGSLFDGSPMSVVILLGIAYVCNRNGINPIQALMMLNLIGGRRRRHIFGGPGFGFGGGGLYNRRRGFRW